MPQPQPKDKLRQLYNEVALNPISHSFIAILQFEITQIADVRNIIGDHDSIELRNEIVKALQHIVDTIVRARDNDTVNSSSVDDDT